MTEEREARSLHFFKSCEDGLGKPRRRYFRVTRSEDAAMKAAAEAADIPVVDWVRKIVIAELTRTGR